MAKKFPRVITPAPVVDVPLTSTGAFEGDPIVLVRLTGATVLLPCYAMDAKQRQMFVNGLPCEHVGEAADGTWIYEQRAY